MRRRSEAAVPRLGARAEPPLPLARPAGLAGVSPDSPPPRVVLPSSNTALEIRLEQQIA